jgi:hypothetical protein
MARNASLSNAPLAELTAELKRRSKRLPQLEKHAATLREQLASVEAQIAALSGISSGKARKAKGPGRRPSPSGLTLAEAIAKVVGPTPMSPREIAAAVVAKKLRNKAKTLTTQVSQILGKDQRFKREGRAQWVRKA